MARRGSRRSTRRAGKNIFGRLYAPFHHFFQATGESVGIVGRGAGDVVKKSINTVDGVGSSYTKHAKMMVNDVLSRKNRRGSRKNRQSTRRNRRNRH
jgi:hypothetical protein